MLTPFRQSDLAQKFITNSYCTFPLLNEEEINFVANIYKQTNGQDNRLQQEQFYGVNYSLGTLSKKENNKVMEPIIEMLKQKMNSYFENFELLGCVFITKPPHTTTTFVYHQDWSYTHEEENAFATCWIPLCDVSPLNGCMSLISGSHRFFKSYRSDSLDSARISFDVVPEEVRTDVPLNKGECLAFHQAAFHGSYPNSSAESRPVLAIVVKPTNASIAHFIKAEKKLKSLN